LAILRDITERKRIEEALLEAHDELEIRVKKRTAELAKANKELRESERRFRDVVENALEWIWEVDANGKYTYASSVVEKILGYKPKEVLKKHFYDLFHPEDQEELKKAAFEVFAKKQPFHEFINWNMHKNGKTVWLSTSGVPILDKKGGLLGYRGVDTDITERKKAEEQIKASLKEKEILLNEIHHRVKNNLEIISSLLDMSSMRTRNQHAINLLSDAHSKIHTMALIHSQLYQSDRFDRIDMGSYIGKLVDYLSQVYTTKKTLITPIIEHSNIYLTVTQAIPCALVLNEAISNAFKHAFKEGQKGTIEISMQRSTDDTISIRVRDDGIGMPEEIDIYTADSLGLKLMRNLVQEQLMGKIQVERTEGTEIFIEFKILEEEVKHA